MQKRDIDFFKTAAAYRQKEVLETDFSTQVYCQRDRFSGGNLLARLIWTDFLRVKIFENDFPAEWKLWEVNDLAFELLKFSSPGEDLPGDDGALKRIHKRWKRQQESPPVDQSHAAEQDVRNGASGTAPPHARYLCEIDKVLCWLTKTHSKIRGGFLSHLREALIWSIHEPRTGRRRSLEEFEEGLELVFQLANGCLLQGCELAEFSMANWQLICNRAMSKWRPYEHKVAVKVGLNEIVSMASGRPMFRVKDVGKKEIGPLDVLDETSARMLGEDMLRRLKRCYSSEANAKQQLSNIFSEVKKLQKYRDTLLSLEQEYFSICQGKPQILLQLAQIFSDCSSTQYQVHGFEDAADYVELATMSPLQLLQLMISYSCSSENNVPGCYGSLLKDMLQWRKAQEAVSRSESFPAGSEELRKLLKVAFPCPRCGSEKTRHEILKVRASDEGFLFQISCLDCKASFAQK